MKLDRIDHIIGIGTNCSVAHYLPLYKIFSGRSPFDWCVCDPTGVSKVLGHLYTHGIEDTIKVFSSMNMETKKIPEFDLYCPHFVEYGQDKMVKRLKRFYEYLNDTSKNILFVFGGPADDNTLPASSIIKDFFKLFKILCLFRPKETFEIAFIHTFYPGTVVKGDITQEMLDNHNITELLGGICPPEEKYWIYACYSALKDHYNLELNPNPTGFHWV